MMKGFEPFLFRAVRLSDLDAVYAFAQTAGLTNLPPDKIVLADYIQQSVTTLSTSHQCPKPSDLYFFVMEDLRTETLAGCCAIYADIGNDPPYYLFRYDDQKPDPTLLLSTDVKSVSEIAALYLAPEYRSNHLGSFLSRARFVFMASHLNYFHDIIIADMRGRRDRDQMSPFWEDFSHRYIKHKNFIEADLEVARHHPAFIDESLPHKPIPVQQLTKRARACIGTPDRKTRPAYAVLIEEQFYPSRYVNVFDAGPQLIAQMRDIKTIQNSFVTSFAGTQQHDQKTLYLIGTTSNDFRAMISTAHIDKHQCYLPPGIAEQLKLLPQDNIRLSPF